MEPPDPEMWTFRIGAALPASDPRSRFVVSVGAALNELLFLHRLFVPDETWGIARRELTAGERVSLMRQIIAAVFEFNLLLDKATSNETTRAALGRLPAAAQDDLKAIRASSASRGRMKSIRDLTSHFPWPDDPELQTALDAVKDQTGWYEAVPTSMASVRAQFADGVLTQLLGDNEHDITTLVIAVQEQSIAAIRLCQAIIDDHLGRLGSPVVRHRPP